MEINNFTEEFGLINNESTISYLLGKLQELEPIGPRQEILFNEWKNEISKYAKDNQTIKSWFCNGFWNLSLLEFLIKEKQYNPFENDADGNNLFYYAIEQEKSKIVAYLLKLPNCDLNPTIEFLKKKYININDDNLLLLKLFCKNNIITKQENRILQYYIQYDPNFLKTQIPPLLFGNKYKIPIGQWLIIKGIDLKLLQTDTMRKLLNVYPGKKQLKALQLMSILGLIIYMLFIFLFGFAFIDVSGKEYQITNLLDNQILSDAILINSPNEILPFINNLVNKLLLVNIIIFF